MHAYVCATNAWWLKYCFVQERSVRPEGMESLATSLTPAFNAVQQVGDHCKQFLGTNSVHLLKKRAPVSSEAVSSRHCCDRRIPTQKTALQAALAANRHLEDGDCGCHSVVKASLAAALTLSIALTGIGNAQARPEGVNKPELLPKTFTPVIDVAGFLSEGQEGRIAKVLMDLEADTGYKLRVLAQNYPNTPGLAVRDFWKVDDGTVVFVADPSLGGNILNFNVGAAVDLAIPRSFWSRLAGKYGNMFYWQEKGEDASIEAAVSAINTCLREPPGPRACSNIE
ncbi:hypothetical protein KP509_33G026500 [Ceratopteris richardii]|uniref:TPM domain-containing protein n=1 Tax=Ceratopteris richardii TaxID=49495 RepID=A0A8T2QN19_CERRI|nr:hypothetical protein KP509_33G026500 [Ceratopteris richardii]